MMVVPALTVLFNGVEAVEVCDPPEAGRRNSSNIAAQQPGTTKL